MLILREMVLLMSYWLMTYINPLLSSIYSMLEYSTVYIPMIKPTTDTRLFCCPLADYILISTHRNGFGKKTEGEFSLMISLGAFF